jgi:hypothetical protein
VSSTLGGAAAVSGAAGSERKSISTCLAESSTKGENGNSSGLLTPFLSTGPGKPSLSCASSMNPSITPPPKPMFLLELKL